MSYVREEDKILSRKNIGSAVYKDARRESLSLDEVQTLYDKIYRFLKDKEELESFITEIDNTLSKYVADYNCTSLNHLISVLKVRGAKDV